MDIKRVNSNKSLFTKPSKKRSLLWFKKLKIDSKFKIQNSKLKKIKDIFNTRKKKGVFSFLFILLLILPTYFIFFHNKAGASWWNDDWFYRKAIQVTNNVATQNNVYITLTLDTSDTAKFQTDCGDLRFTKDGGQPLPYYIQSGCGTASTVVYVAFDSFPTGQQSVYYYYGNPYVENGNTLAQTGSVTQNNMRLSIVNGTAFVDFSSLGTLTNNLNSKAVISDSTGKKIIGYIKSAGTGETYGSELVINGDFSSTSNWSTNTSFSIGGGVLSKNSSGSYGSAWQSNVAIVDGLHVYSFNMISITGGSIALYPTGVDGSSYVSFDTSGTKTGKYIQIGASSRNIYFDGSLGTVATIDDLSLKQILTPSTTGVTITSTQNGGTFNWASEESGFKRNDLSNYTYTIFPTNFSTEASNYIIGAISAEEKSPAPVLYLPLNEGYGTIAHDESSGKNNGTITGATWKDENECVSGKCLGLISGNYVNVPDNNLLDFGTNDFTISAWALNEDYTYPKSNFMIKKSANCYSDGASNLGFDVGHGYTPNGLDICIRDEFNNYFKNTLIFNSSFQPSALKGKWTHYEIVFSRSSGKVLAYVNGVKQANELNISSVTGSINNGSNLTLGTMYGWMTDGKYDEIKIYPYARTATQIKQDYSAGLAGQNTIESVATAFGSTSNKWLTDGLVGYWKMDEAIWNGTASEVKDVSGNNNHGTGANAVTTGGGKFGSGGVFDGINDYASISDSESFNFGTNPITISSWVKFNSDSLGVYRGIISQTLDSFELNKDSSNRLRLEMKYAGDVVLRGTEAIPSLTVADRWYFVTATFNPIDGEMEFYVDGDKKNTTYTDTRVGGVLKDSTNNVNIGSRSGADLFMSGSLDELRIYNRRLSSDEIQSLYKYAPAPVLHLKMDEKSGTTAYDTSGNSNNGVLTNGPIWETGKIGSALKFDGFDDQLSVNNNASFYVNQEITLEAWVNQSSSVNEQKIIDKRADWNNLYGYSMFTSAGSLYFEYGNGVGYSQQAASLSGTSYKINNWNHLAITLNGTTIKYYLNGILFSTRVGVSGIVNDTTALGVGRSVPRSLGFRGLIDDVKIYNYARTQEQIFEDMNSQGASLSNNAGALKKPILDLNFNEGYENKAYDSSNSKNNGTLSCAGATCSLPVFKNDGKSGKALYFTGSGSDRSFVTANSVNVASTVGEKMSWTMWVKPNVTQTGSGWLMRNGVGIDENYGWMLESQSGGKHKVKLEIYDTGFRNIISAGYYVPNNQWSQLTLIYSQGEWFKIYVDGIFKEQVAVSYGTSVPSTSSFNVGGHAGTTGQYFNGYIDEVKIYNYALGEDEIKTLYNESSAMVMGSDESRNNNGTEVSGANKDYCIPGDNAKCDKPVLELKMDEMTGTTAYDTSGNGNNGTLVGGPIWDTGKNGSAIKFDGVDDYVNIPDNDNLDLGTGDFSVGLWVKIPFAGIKQVGYWPGIFGKGGGTTAPAKTWGFDRQTSTLDRIHWAQATEGGGAYQVAITTPVLTSGWHHVNAIRSSDTTTLYVDGKSVGVDTSAGGDLSNDNDIRIGRECSLSYNINNFNNQSVDDVKIYNYARTPAQIAWDYNRGKAVNNWTFDEGSGTTVHDEGDNKNDGTITGATWKNESECKTGKCLSFDGTDDQVSSNGNVDLSGTNKVSTSFWFKFATSDSTARIVLEHSTDFNSNNAFMIDHSDSGVDGNFTLADKCSINYNLIYTDNSYGDNQWHHFVGVIDRSLGINQNFIYIDGQIVPVTQSYNYNCNENFSSYPLYLGSRSGSNNDYTGQIDNVKIFNYALTAEQVKMEYNGGAVSFE